MKTHPRLLLGALALAPLLDGCGGAAPQYSHSPSVEPPQPAFAEVAVVQRGRPADMRFVHYGVNPTIDTAETPLSTFSVDVDTASYTVARGHLERGHLPDPASVRVEEFVNRFDAGDAPPQAVPFAVHAEAFPSPNRRGYHVLRLGLKAQVIDAADRQPAHLTFVVDVSGSMQRDDRLGLVKQALGLLASQLDERDSVAIVGYAGDATVLLEATAATDRDTILTALGQLAPRGSTNAHAGLMLGYRLAQKRQHLPGVHRVVLCSDGVANNGVDEPDAIAERVAEFAQEGVGLTAVGFGMGHYNDVLMERLAQRADGQYHYVDRLQAAKRVFVEALTGTLQTVAKDVKLQVAFDPTQVTRYRLIGYENRKLAARDFDNDAKDAGEIGAGHAVQALYEVKFAQVSDQRPFATLRIRYKAPKGGASRKLEVPLGPTLVRADRDAATPGARLALVAAGFAEKLRAAYWARTLSYEDLLAQLDGLPQAWHARPEVIELHGLIQRALELDRRPDRFEGELPVARMGFDHVPVVQ